MAAKAARRTRKRIPSCAEIRKAIAEANAKILAHIQKCKKCRERAEDIAVRDEFERGMYGSLRCRW